MRLNLITLGVTETITLEASGSTINCALRTLAKNAVFGRREQIDRRRAAIQARKRRTNGNRWCLLPKKNSSWPRNPTSVDAFILIMDTGARPSEAAAIAWREVDFVRRTIWIDKSKTDKGRRHLVMTTRSFPKC